MLECGFFCFVFWGFFERVSQGSVHYAVENYWSTAWTQLDQLLPVLGNSGLLPVVDTVALSWLIPKIPFLLYTLYDGILGLSCTVKVIRAPAIEKWCSEPEVNQEGSGRNITVKWRREENQTFS